MAAVATQTPDIMGERQPGQDVRSQNVMACQAVANIVKSSLGPVGLDKMLVDDIGDVTVTNDGATILQLLDVEHPCAKILVELAERQDREVGDGTTSVVILAAELLKRANDLVRNNVHPTNISSGYRLSLREGCKYVNENLAVKVVEAVQAVKMTNARGEIKYPIKAINILKAHGKSAKDSYLLHGEANMTKERIKKLLKAGANVVLTKKGIDDMALKYFVEAGAIAVRRVRKEDIHHVAKATGATLVSTLADMEGEETFDSSLLGHADEVVEERIADDDVILIKGTKTSSAVSLILRGANNSMLDEMERALHDSLSIVKRTLESNTVVVGGGAVEAALSVYLENLATTLGSREQLAIAEFCRSYVNHPKGSCCQCCKRRNGISS